MGGGAITGQYDYEPFGKVSWQSGPSKRLSFIDKEKDKESSLGDFGVRKYDDGIGRFTSIDPLWEKYRSLSPYNYSNNNPLILKDPSGLEPGDLFLTPAEAAHDFGMTYNDNSIRESREYGSTIYIVKKDNQTFYTYTVPSRGGEATVQPSPAPEGAKRVANVHSHGKWSWLANDNVFSKQDKKVNGKMKIDGYLTTPDGSLKKYDVKTKSETVVATDLPSDPNDPERKNTVSPREEKNPEAEYVDDIELFVD